MTSSLPRSVRQGMQGSAMIPVIILIVAILPLLALFARKANVHNTVSTKDRLIHAARDMATNSMHDYMRIFSEDPYFDHYRSYFLQNHYWNFNLGRYTTYFNQQIGGFPPPFDTEEGFRQNHLFTVRALGQYITNRTERFFTGVVSFQNPLFRFGLVATSTFSISPGDALDGQTLNCGAWVGGGVILDPGTTFTFSAENMAAPPLQFGSTNNFVVNGDIVTAGALFNRAGAFRQINYGGSFVGADPTFDFNYIPVDLSTRAMENARLVDFSYYATRAATGTSIPGTIISFVPGGISIDRPGFGIETYNTGGLPLTFYSVAGPLIINGGPIGNRITIVSGGSVQINAPLAYNSATPTQAGLDRSLAVLCGGNLSFGPQPADYDVVGFYYSKGGVSVNTGAAGRRVTLHGTLVLDSPTPPPQQITSMDGSKLTIRYDIKLWPFAPPMIPERPVFCRLRFAGD